MEGPVPNTPGNWFMFWNIGLGLVRHAIVQLSTHTYEGYIGSGRDNDTFFHLYFSPGARSGELMKFNAFACMSTALNATTIESLLSAIKRYHQLARWVEIGRTHPLVVRSPHKASYGQSSAPNSAFGAQ